MLRRAVVNLSNESIPDKVVDLLSLGPTFAFNTSKNLPLKQIISDVEYIVQVLPDDKKDLARSEIINTITNHSHSIKRYEHKNKNNNRSVADLFKFSKSFFLAKEIEDKKLVVVSSDKGGNTCILSELQYKICADNLLSDKTTYRLMAGDPTQRIQKRNNLIVTRLFDKKFIDVKTKNSLVSLNAISPKFYLLPKTHKKDNHQVQLTEWLALWQQY
jgi:hypothetical protein